MNLRIRWDKTSAVSDAFPEETEHTLPNGIGLRQPVIPIHYPLEIQQRKVEQIAYTEISACDCCTPIFEAASIMSQQQVSCLFVKNEQHHIVGYVTDRILRDVVVAQKVDVHQPVQQVMDSSVVSVDSQAYISEAAILMFQTGTPFLLIEEKGQYLGMLNRHQLLNDEVPSPFAFIQEVKHTLGVEALKDKWEQVPGVVMQLLSTGVKAEIVNHVIATISDTITQKVIEGVIQEMGIPPARFVFMALGSEGRKEQTLKTDQDNAILYEDKANEQREEVREYFLNLADLVSERLNTIGFSYCTGGYMAKNPQWTHSVSYWKRNYEQWINTSNPETVMHFSAFFDCRSLYGDISLMDELKAFLDLSLQKPLERFLYHMANNALQYEPPLTFFNNIRTFHKGSQQVFNLKKAMTPIVDLVRVYALQHRIFLTNTGERLEAIKNKEIFSEKEYLELRQAYYYLMGIRLKKQANQIIAEGSSPDNYLDPKRLTKIEQVTLKEVFKIIENFQLKIKIAFTKSLFG